MIVIVGASLLGLHERIPSHSITAQVGGHFTLWMWREITLHN